MKRAARGGAVARACAFAVTTLLLLPAWQAASAPPLPGFKPQPDAAALPLPGLRPALPERGPFAVLDARDAAAYRQIFAVQQHADWTTADRLIAGLGDRLLMGHVLFQRYMHPTGWRSSFAELAGWLAAYGDHPGADQLYRLARRRRPAGAAAPAAPWAGSLGRIHGDAPARADEAAGPWDHLPAAQRRAAEALALRIARHIGKGENDAGRALLNEAAASDPLVRDRLAAEVARGYFVAGDDRLARALAEPALERSGGAAPLAGWIAGLAAWRQGELDASRRAFEILAAGGRDRELAAAAAYWAARANLRLQRPGQVRPWLAAAATASPWGFYGLLARRALGGEIALRNTLPQLSGLERQQLAALAEVRRAAALAQAGQQHRADREFDRLDAYDRPGLAAAVMRLAADLGLPATQYRLARQLLAGFGERFDAALYPLPPWQPQRGFTLDPALLFAVMRRESAFRAFAISSAGARGPMQIMPATAAAVTGQSAFRRARRHLLSDPEVALEVGQDYLGHLLALDHVKGNLFFALAAYNGGPTRLKAWQRAAAPADDPLLFIESIPARETRFFVETVMASYWLYRLRQGLATPVLEQVAAGGWPLYPGSEGNTPAGPVLAFGEGGAP